MQIGNLLALVYGIAFIQGACNFYELESSTEQKAKEYDEKLDEVLFLQRNSKLDKLSYFDKHASI